MFNFNKQINQLKEQERKLTGLVTDTKKVLRSQSADLRGVTKARIQLQKINSLLPATNTGDENESNISVE